MSLRRPGGRPVLWIPSDRWIESANITRFSRDLGLPEAYLPLWHWSVRDIERFWAAIWDYYEVGDSGGTVLAQRAMPGAQWFPGARLNYAEGVFRGKPADRVAIRHASELRSLATWTWRDLRNQVARIAGSLRALGVGPGDRVAALMPNIPETVAAFLAAASVGAVWSSAAPEFGAQAVIDRFGQIEPTVLLAVDGYRYGGRDFDCSAKVAAISGQLPGCAVVRFGYLDGSGWPRGFAAEESPLVFTPVPFGHPLWILYSSGTTGLPKGLVHGHGGVLLEQLKLSHLHLNGRPSDRFFWFSTTGWMMWNLLVGVLVTDASIVLFDGDPAGTTLWSLAAESGLTFFGTSAAFISAAMKAGVEPAGGGRDLSALTAVGSTGSPLSPEAYRWVYEKLGPDLWLSAPSGGTDVVTPFVAGVPTLPVRMGEIQAPALGVKVEAWSPAGRRVVGEVGELVVTEPMPSMPLYLWGDRDGERYRQSYFEMFPGVWRHGDWIEFTPDGGSVIYGRSDSTINRGGVRMGTAEIYRAVLTVPEVEDCLVVDVPVDGDRNWMPLFVVLTDDMALDQALGARIRATVREQVSPRHVPDEIVQAPAIPRTLSGKVLEIPVKRILMGQAAQDAASRDSLADPAALDWFAEYADQVRKLLGQAERAELPVQR